MAGPTPWTRRLAAAGLLVIAGLGTKSAAMAQDQGAPAEGEKGGDQGRQQPNATSSARLGALAGEGEEDGEGAALLRDQPTYRPARRALVEQEDGAPDPRPLIKIGYFREYETFGVACTQRWFDAPSTADEVGYRVGCYPQTSGNWAVSKLDRGDLDISFLGSTPYANAVSRGVEIQAFYIAHSKGQSQGLACRAGASGTAVSPWDLAGRVVVTPGGSTMHYHMMFLIDLLGAKICTGLTPSADCVVLRFMSPAQIKLDWDANDSIDCAAVWGGTWHHVRGNGGQVVLFADALKRWGRETFNVVAARTEFVANRPDIVHRVAEVLRFTQETWLRGDPNWATSADDGFLAALEPYTEGTLNTSELNNRLRIASFISEFDYIDAGSQSTCSYLGAPTAGCLGTAAATRMTSEFFLAQHMLPTIVPTGKFWAILQDGREDVFFQSRVTDTFATAAAEVDLGQLAPQAAPLTSAVPPGMTIDALPCISSTFSGTVFDFNNNFQGGGRTGNFSDKGPSQIAGLSYNDNLRCHWQVEVPSDARVAELHFSGFRVWPGDFVRVYAHTTHSDNAALNLDLFQQELIEQCLALEERSCEDTSSDTDLNSLDLEECQRRFPQEDQDSLDNAPVLLAQLSGFDVDWPAIRWAKEYQFRERPAMLEIVFVTDGQTEKGYNLPGEGDGWTASYSVDVSGCTSRADCSNNGECSADGTCLCEPGFSGAVCSYRHCLGTQRAVELSGTFKSSPDALTEDHLYESLVDCIFEVYSPGNSFVTFDIEVDSEDTYDFLQVRTGSGHCPGNQCAVLHTLTGHRRVVAMVPLTNGVASLRFQTDAMGRRSGFSASYQVRSSDAGVDICSADADCSGHGTCQSAQCVCEPGWDGLVCESSVCSHLSEVVLAAPSHGSEGVLRSQPDGQPLEKLLKCPWQFPSPVGAAAIRLEVKQLDFEPHSRGKWHFDQMILTHRPISHGPCLNSDATSNTADHMSLVLSQQQCGINAHCGESWHTGKCTDDTCELKSIFEMPLPLHAELRTNRNDGQSANGHMMTYDGFEIRWKPVFGCASSELQNLLPEITTGDDEFCIGPVGSCACEQNSGSCAQGMCSIPYGGGQLATDCGCGGQKNVALEEERSNLMWVLFAVMILAALVAGVTFMLMSKKKENKRLSKTAEELQQQVAGLAKELEQGLKGVWRIEVDMPKTEDGKAAPVAAALNDEFFNPLAGVDMEAADASVDTSNLHDVDWFWAEDENQLHLHNPMHIMPGTNYIQYKRADGYKLEIQHRRYFAAKNESVKSELKKITMELVKLRNIQSGSKFEMDIEAMVQTNVKSRYKRKIRRVVVRKTEPTARPKSLEPGMKLPDPPKGVVWVANLQDDGDGVQQDAESVLAVRAGQVVQVTKEDKEWLFGNVLYDPTTEDGGGGSGASSGWFPKMLATVADVADMRKIAQALGSSGMSALDPPNYWDADKNNGSAQLVSVTDPAERTRISTAFKAGLPTNIEVQSIERVENPVLWQSYAVKLSAMHQRKTAVDYRQVNNQGEIERKYLFHGTTADVVTKVVQQGFNRAFAGRNAVKFGKGVYFARDSNYSARVQYAKPDSSGVCSIFLCRLAVGDYCFGKDGQLTPDYKNDNETFDTTVDNVRNPTIFVAYHDAQVYPEYLLKYKRR